MKLLLLFICSFPFIAQAVELKITHPRIEQKAKKVYEVLCESQCSFTIAGKKKHTGKVDKAFIANDLNELEQVVSQVQTKEIPSAVERGSRIVTFKNDNGIVKFYLPPASSWKKDQQQLNLKISELLTKIEFQLDKARAK